MILCKMCPGQSKGRVSNRQLVPCLPLKTWSCSLELTVNVCLWGRHALASSCAQHLYRTAAPKRPYLRKW
ncbi:unnamed protein product, partial [Chrysoparadoxa australica]